MRQPAISKLFTLKFISLTMQCHRPHDFIDDKATLASDDASRHLNSQAIAMPSLIDMAILGTGMAY